MTASVEEDATIAAAASGKAAPLLRLDGLSKAFTLHILRGKRVEAFRDVSLEIAAGGSLGVVGTSGSGKSSLLKTIFRTYLPTSGSVLYREANGRVIDLASASEQELLRLRRTQIGYVTQFLRAQPRVPALDIVAGPRAALGVPLEQARDEARALLSRLRLPEDLWDSYPVLFSGGEQQRVNVARGLITRPRLLLLDEPTSALDVENGATVVELLKEARAAGTTLISVFHDPEMVRAVCDQVALLHRGALVAIGPPAEIDVGAAFAA